MSCCSSATLKMLPGATCGVLLMLVNTVKACAPATGVVLPGVVASNPPLMTMASKILLPRDP